MLRHVTDASQLAAKPQQSKATLSSVAKPLGTRQASAPLLPTLIAFGQEVWYNITSIFYLYSFRCGGIPILSHLPGQEQDPHLGGDGVHHQQGALHQVQAQD